MFFHTLYNHKILSMALYSDQFILPKAQLFSCHSFIFRRSHLLPDQLFGTIQVCHLMWGSASLFLPSEPHIYSFHTLTHSYLVGRSMVIGHIPMVHAFFNVIYHHRHDGTYPSILNELGSTLVRLLSHMCQYCPWGDMNSQHSGELSVRHD